MEWRDSLAQAASTSAMTSQLPLNERFNRSQTLYLTELMREDKEKKEQRCNSLADVSKRISKQKGNGMQLWKENAAALQKQFSQVFIPEKVRRRWGYLNDTYKKEK